MKVRVLVAQANFNLFDRVVELHLRVNYTDLADAFGVDENDVLLIDKKRGRSSFSSSIDHMETCSRWAISWTSSPEISRYGCTKPPLPA